MAKTRATVALEQGGVAFTIHTYAYDPEAASIGLAAAQALGVDPVVMLKTLMVLVDGKPALAITSSDRELSLKKVAAALGGRAAAMAPVAGAQRSSGYKVGGGSPFGQTKRLAVALAADAAAQPLIYLNGGQRGVQVRLDPREAVRVLGAVVAEIGA